MEQFDPPYNVRLHGDSATRLAQQGSSLLFLDAPPSLSFGMDLQMFVTGPKFKGVKMVPPGPHFVYYSVSSREGREFSPIIGFFVYCDMSEVFVRRWDAQQERFVKLTDAEEEQRYALGVKNFDFDANLGPYDIHRLKKWQELSKYITKDVISRFEPLTGEITIMAEAELAEQHPQTTAERNMAKHLQSSRERMRTQSTGGDPDVSGRCPYTRLPRHVRRCCGSIPEDLTSLNMDKSEILELTLSKHYGGSEDVLLGEQQFAFIAFLMGQSLVSFSQWKAIVTLMLGCQKAPLSTRTRLFVKFLDALYHQMKQSLKPGEAETELFSDDPSWFTADNFFGLLCSEFIATLKNAQPVDGELLFQANRLKNLLETCLGWDLESEISYTNTENDEYAPVVVEL